MKKIDLERKLKDLGWRYLREGGSHEIWTDGKRTIAVPRHREVNEMTAKKILREARG